MKIFSFFIIFIATLIIQGCVPAAVIGAAVSAKAAIDPRTIGTQIDDNTLELRINSALSFDKLLKKLAHIHAVVYQGKVLLVGQVLNPQLIHRAEQIAVSNKGIHSIINEIRFEKPISLKTASSDAWITTKIRSQLLTSDKVKSANIKVITENGEVFLLGLINKHEAQIVKDIANRIKGVKYVKTAFIYKK